jgi:predicted nuclease of predicted toxin-antitoxin system
MPRFLADEDFNNRIVRGIRRRSETIDIVRVHEAGLLGEPDTEVLEWAAAEDRILLTHDAATMIDFAYERIREGRKFPGLIAVSQFAGIGKVVDDIEVIAADDSFALSDQVIYLPFKNL